MGGPDRYWKTTIDPYNQVFALTQHIINQGIDNLYVGLNTDKQGNPKPPLPVTLEADEHNVIENVVFGPPQIIVQADYSNVKSVNFRFHLKSGTLQLRNYKGKLDGKTQDEKLRLIIDDWFVTVPVDVGFVELDLNTPRGKTIAGRSILNKKPDHSIYELLLDLASMAVGNGVWDMGIWHEKDTYIGVDGVEKPPDGWVQDQEKKINNIDVKFLATMNFFIAQVAKILTDANLNSMGFAVQAPDANDRATFDVNNVRYQTYPWTNPDTGVEAKPAITGDGRLNYLLYLETVGTNVAPLKSQKNSILSSQMGNWTTGRKPGVDSPTSFGSYILSSEMFMEKFLIPRLSCINRVMSIDIGNVVATAYTKWLIIYYNVGASWGVGQGEQSKDPTEFQLKKSTVPTLVNEWYDNAKDWLQPMTVSPGEGSNVWGYQDIEFGPTGKRAPQADSFGLQCDCAGDTITLSRVYTKAGSNAIVYEGRTWTKFESKVNPPIGSNEYSYLYAKAKWSITFTLSEVTDGGIKIIIDAQKPVVDVTADGTWANSDFYKTSMTNMYNVAYSNFEYYLGAIRNSLEGQEKFNLPASGVFYFKNPVMNYRGDLVCDLEFNGNPEIGNPKAKQQRETVAVVEYTNMPHPVTLFEEGQKEKKI